MTWLLLLDEQPDTPPTASNAAPPTALRRNCLLVSIATFRHETKYVQSLQNNMHSEHILGYLNGSQLPHTFNIHI